MEQCICPGPCCSYCRFCGVTDPDDIRGEEVEEVMDAIEHMTPVEIEAHAEAYRQRTKKST